MARAQGIYRVRADRAELRSVWHGFERLQLLTTMQKIVASSAQQFILRGEIKTSPYYIA
jgi:hypothetical protein